MTRQTESFAETGPGSPSAPASAGKDQQPAFPPIFQLVYASTYIPGRITSARGALNNIIATSRAHNEKSGVSGCLIFDGYSFIQILEGNSASVQATFERIRRDRRHRDVFVVGAISCHQRSFAGSPMNAFLRSSECEGVFIEQGLAGSIDSRKLSSDIVLALAARLSALSSEPVT